MLSDDLHSTTLGDHGSPVVFCHGLFGQGRNWTQIGKALADDHRILLVDLPHHGRSSWSERFDYLDIADQVAGLLSADDPVTLVGHSMGGKAAMVLALRHPELVERLCVVDVAPVAYDRVGEFAGYIEAMQGLDLDSLSQRGDADTALEAAVPNPTVRSFLLQSLVREGTGADGGWRWRLNLEALERDLGELRGFPETPPGASFDGPVLWIAGANSTYVLPEDRPRMDELFPTTRLVTIKNAGHWVHSEQPETFTETLRRFLERVEKD